MIPMRSAEIQNVDVMFSGPEGCKRCRRDGFRDWKQAKNSTSLIVDHYNCHRWLSYSAAQCNQHIRPLFLQTDK
jgi:hypothetical protein